MSCEGGRGRTENIALAACFNADVVFRRIANGRLYFHAYLGESWDGPHLELSVPLAGVTEEVIANALADWEHRNVLPFTVDIPRYQEEEP